MEEKLAEQKKLEEEMNALNEKNRAYIKNMVKEKNLPEPKALTRRQRKELDASGLHIYKLRKTDERSFSEVKDCMCDWILEKVYPEFDFDNLGDAEANWFAMYVFGLSYRDDLAEKNL